MLGIALARRYSVASRQRGASLALCLYISGRFGVCTRTADAKHSLARGVLFELDTHRLHMVTARRRSRLMWTYTESAQRMRLGCASKTIERFLAEGLIK